MKELRQATVEDLPQLAKLAQEFSASSEHLQPISVPLFLELWEKILTSGIGTIFVLVDGETLVGTIGWMAHREPYEDALVAQEMALYITEQARGGTGLLRLLRAFEVWATENRCARIRIGHLKDLMPDKLCHLYERLGYRQVEVIYSKELQVAPANILQHT